MKKFTKKLKGKKVLSFVLAAIMLATTFNMALPMLKLDASAVGEITTSDGTNETVSQNPLDIDRSVYEKYAADFLGGASRSTGIVIPGMAASEDYVVQGMTYYPERDWMLVTAYHADSAETGTAKSSKVFAIDAATGEFAAMFSFLNPDGTPNTDHGGGIAVSEHNLYYACGDTDRMIAYAPISTTLKTAPVGQHTVIQLAAKRDFVEVGSVDNGGKTAYTAYVCYDEGILWTGNFYDPGAALIGGADWATIAKDYNVPANSAYKSMIFGYELKGDSSTEEWNNLVGATGEDCQGNPSYAIGLNNALRDVQYAVVDNGKLYLSCSFGTGEGTLSVSIGGMEPYSSLIVADIDLSVAGTRDVTIQTGSGTRTVKAHDIQKYSKHDMMPMSEGLCFIEDKLYITFEGASNKYYKNAGIMGNCGHPVDVIWELDPYELMEVEKAEPENSIYYEKVMTPTDIKDGQEYIIVYESGASDPITQKNILYAFNAEGNFEGHKLSKSTADNINGYDAMIGHPITEYTILKAGEEDSLGNTYNRDILYLGNVEKDDVESVRWTLNKRNTETGTNYTIRNTDTYFANCNNFYVDGSRITMLPSSATNLLETINIGQIVADNGYFYISNNGSYMWCNDGLKAKYNTAANNYYKNNIGMFNGETETPGTFHCNGLNSQILGGSIDGALTDPLPLADAAFQIYRRVIDDAASTYESRVYTDLKAELQADGTYTIDLETYAISPNHYQYVGERPTDYIFVVDASSSMASAGSTALIEYNGSLAVSSLCQRGDSEEPDEKTQQVYGYAFSDPEEDIYMKHSDGKYYKVYMAIHTGYDSGFLGSKSIRQKYYVYYVADDGLYYCVEGHKLNTTGKTKAEWKAWVDSFSNESDYSTKSNNTTGILGAGRQQEDVYQGVHYRFDNSADEEGKYTRLGTIKTVAADIVDDIAAQNSDNRIALVQYGSGSSYLAPTGWASSGYADAFWKVDANGVNTLKTNISNIGTTTQTRNDGIELDAANQIIDNSGVKYDATGDRNVVIIFMSDGIPGADDDTTNITSAANAVINKALQAKNKGAFIYSVMTGQASVNNFDKKAYMEGVSTKYAAAQSMSSLGGQSIDGINYFMNLSSCTLDTYLDFGAVTMKEVKQNTAVGLANLDANAILRQELSDSFIIPKDKSPEVSFIEGKFDAIGRFSFSKTPGTATGVTCDWDSDSPEILKVKGYDYSTQYISKGKTGNKLRIRITDVLANEAKTIQNTPISNTSTSALYQNETQMGKGVMFKQLPTRYFNIPEYTYVLDYGLDLLDTDVNGTLCAVSDGLTKQDVNNYNKDSSKGLVKIQEGDQNLIYHTTPTNTTDSGYVLIQRDSGKYDWFEIKVVPASNVYFEETEFAKTAGTGTVAWETTPGGTSTPHRDLPGENDPVGYDAAYDNTNTYSNGTALSATVDSTNKRSKTATVSFKGNGIDIISACGPTTGMQIINIKNAQGKSVAASIVDTYYKDDTFTQVPVFSWRGNADPDEVYTVETTAVYLSTAGALKKSGFKSSLIDTGLVMNTADDLNTNNVQAMLDAAGVEDIDAENLELVWFDDNSVLNGGTGVAPTKKGARAGETSSVTLNNYIDGFRIYNPLGSNYSSDFEASEQGSMYYNVIDNLADGTFTPEGSLNGEVAFVTGSLANGETLSFANYESIGPKNELYLKGNAQTAVAFKTPFVDGVKVMVSLRAVDGPTTVKINEKEFTVKSATEMYYDITDLLVAEDGKATVSITNSGSGILAVNNIKLTNTVSGAGLMELNESDIETVRYYATMEPVQATVENGVVTPVVEEEVPEDNTNTDTDTEESEKEEFSIFSIFEMIIALIEKILYSAFGAGSMA